MGSLFLFVPPYIWLKNLMKFGLIIIVCLAFGCNNSESTKSKIMVDTVSTIEDIPGVPPKKVTGTFADHIRFRR